MSGITVSNIRANFDRDQDWIGQVCLFRFLLKLSPDSFMGSTS